MEQQVDYLVECIFTMSQEDLAKTRLHHDYIFHGLLVGQFGVEKAKNLIKTSGLPDCGKAYLAEELEERVSGQIGGRKGIPSPAVEKKTN